MNWLLPIPVLLPLFSAGLALLAFRRPRLQQLISLLTLIVVLAVGISLLIATNAAPVVLDIGNWAAPIGVTLIADRLSALMLVVSQIVTLAVLSYSVAQNLTDSDPDVPIVIFHPTYLILVAGVSNAFLTGDLFNLYVGFEILLAASFVLITLGGTQGRTRSGTVYVVISLVSSLIFLIGIAYAYAATGTVNLAQLALRLREISPSASLIIEFTLLVAFGIKAAVFPLSAWLPDSYPTAPAPVTAVFAGLLTKVGIYALIRLEVLLFPGHETDLLLAIVGIATMLVGILGAVAQDDIRRILSFTLVSHIGFMIWGLALQSVAGIAATIYYAAHHILVQAGLFLLVGLIERYRGTASLRHLGGLLRERPLLSVMFLLASLNLIGIPPFSGFIGKLGLTQASVTVASIPAWSLLAAGMVTSFLTLYVVVKVWNFAFWQPEDDQNVIDREITLEMSQRQQRAYQRRERQQLSIAEQSELLQLTTRTEAEQNTSGTNWLMYGAASGLLIIMLGMSVFAGTIYQYAQSAAFDQTTRYTYIHSVIGEDGRGKGISKHLREKAPQYLQEWSKQWQKSVSEGDEEK
ncbi:Na+/H+ antiporter subunit D [Gleimia sp. 6138-11-ORH1]|uniref:Na+/H+ antiporter subunit D n=1 Tax=Gleimia sp. 6138-11-ORH1 TaxID=2973937 RepID=UPI002169AF94|nr:Na+/H+ antiporter subunit D [Gleimia sp. 6138-11-ORH1]MCS4484705.1 Na+/H+ antiporter subunit D [Gleimia sp. 6138-11-ORH1]